MVQKADRDRIKALLTEAITVLCKNGLGYKYTCAVEGLLGITLDEEEIFLVNINETIAGATKRPTPEQDVVAKPETGSPAGGSPAGTPKRRRRRSNSGGTDSHRASPAKRANYGSGEEQQQQQQESDVIVIKEEVSQEEFSDFYGDTGDGQDDNSQYALQQQQADQYGAGCSQWDTSQTQGGQSDWPAFNPTQQQQHAISQAASSAMLSPSQMSGSSTSMSTLPAPKLRSRPVCDILNQQILEPILHNHWSVSAFRMTWPRPTDPKWNMWERIVLLRAELDGLVQQIPGVLFLVSAINATSAQMKSASETSYKVHPGVVYWLVSRQPMTDQRSLCSHMNTNNCGATLKLVLQPYQTTEKDIRNALFSGVKDNMEGCVRRLVEESCVYCYGDTERLKEPLIKIYVAKDGPKDMLSQALNDLAAARFRAELVNI